MHSKQKGILGELKIAAHLAKLEIPVFSELGDLSRVDLIALINNKPIKIQVKACTSEDNKVHVYSRKSGPNYKFNYSLKDVDIFAVYVLDKDICFFVKSSEIVANKANVSFRLEATKNNQVRGVRYIEDYRDIFKAIDS